MRFLLAVFLFASSTAQASWFQEYCNTGEGTVKVSQGHNENQISVTTRTWNNGTLKDRRTVLPNATLEVSSSKELENESKKYCSPDGSGGMITWTNVNYKKVQISNQDGALFSKNIVGVSEDRRFVKAFLICELNGNSESPCTP